jgi:hypothetical protein
MKHFECHMDSESLYCVLQWTHNSKSNSQITNDRKEKKKKKKNGSSISNINMYYCIKEFDKRSTQDPQSALKNPVWQFPKIIPITLQFPYI